MKPSAVAAEQAVTAVVEANLRDAAATRARWKKWESLHGHPVTATLEPTAEKLDGVVTKVGADGVSFRDMHGKDRDLPHEKIRGIRKASGAFAEKIAAGAGVDSSPKGSSASAYGSKVAPADAPDGALIFDGGWVQKRNGRWLSLRYDAYANTEERRQVTLKDPAKAKMPDAVRAKHDAYMANKKTTESEERAGVSGLTVESAVQKNLRVVEADSPKVPLTNKPGVSNWVEKYGAIEGASNWIRRAAEHLKGKGKPEGQAIPIAKSAAAKMCASGDTNFPGVQQVNAGSRAQACAAVAQWDRARAKAKAARVTEAVLAFEMADDPHLLSEADHREVIALVRDHELHAQLLEAETSGDEDEGKMNSGKRADNMKVKCGKCNWRGVPKDGKCGNGHDVSKQAAFAKRLKGKTQEAEAEDADPVRRAVREALESS